MAASCVGQPPIEVGRDQAIPLPGLTWWQPKEWAMPVGRNMEQHFLETSECLLGQLM